MIKYIAQISQRINKIILLTWAHLFLVSILFDLSVYLLLRQYHIDFIVVVF